MIFHRNLVIGVVQCLDAIFNDHRYADRALEYLFKQQDKWGARDRAFVAEQVYDITRYYRKYSAVLELLNYSITHWHLLAVHLINTGFELPEYEEWKTLSIAKIKKNCNNESFTLAQRESYPDWLCERISAMHHGVSLLQALNHTAPLTLLVNTIKSSLQQVTKALQADKIEYKVVNETAITLPQRINIFAKEIFKLGWIEVQDEGSQRIGAFTQVQPGMRVIDACAGAGGKSLHLAALMQNKGRLMSLDVEQYKLDELKKRARRNGVSIVETRLIESSKTIKRLANAADVLLLDVPCSGTGVLRRNPDAKWKMSELRLSELLQTQQHILQQYAGMTKINGTMIYATCSILTDENERQVTAFLQNNKNFVLEENVTLRPDQYDGDGFYMARLRRLS